MPVDFQEDFKDYVGSASMLTVPPYQRHGQELMLSRHAKAERELVTRLRALRKLKPLTFREDPDFASLRIEDMLENALAQDAEYERSLASEARTSRSAPSAPTAES